MMPYSSIAKRRSILELIYTSSEFCRGGHSDLLRVVRFLIFKNRSTDAYFFLRRAYDAISSSDYPEAISSLEASQRRDPSNRLITLLIGDVKYLSRDPTCAEQYAFLRQVADFRLADLRLSLNCYQQSRLDEAAQFLDRFLRTSAAPGVVHFQQYAIELCRQSGAVGWCSLNSMKLLDVHVDDIESGLRVLDVRIGGRSINVDRNLIHLEPHLARLRLEHEIAPKDTVVVKVDKRPLIGSKLQFRSIVSVEGFVESGGGNIFGWCWHPGDPLADPPIDILADQSRERFCDIRAEPNATLEKFDDLRLYKFFKVTPDAFRYERKWVAVESAGSPLVGSPLRPLGSFYTRRQVALRIATRFSAIDATDPSIVDDPFEESLAADFAEIPASALPYKARDVLVVIPVYKGFQTTLDTIENAYRNSPKGTEILAISDASPDVKLLAELRKLHAESIITLMEETINRGFPATANIGLKAAARSGRDVVLLNSDTLVPPNWLERLRAPLFEDNSVGTVTPLSNAASVFSFPQFVKINPIPKPNYARAIAEAAYLANGDQVVEAPTGHGFCLYIRHECLVQTGTLRDDVFGRGYGEENDFCLRARHLGWRSVITSGTYVAHIESQSFTDSKEQLVSRNLKTLNFLHPGYDRQIQQWIAKDPLAPARQRIMRELWRRYHLTKKVKVFVTHNRGGGILRFVETNAHDAENEGFSVVILRPSKGSEKGKACVAECRTAEFAFELKFSVPRDLDELRSFLQESRVESVEVHHFLGHLRETVDAAIATAGNTKIFVHDYAWFCPRITLTNGGNRYCGEPGVNVCEQCVTINGSNIDEDISPKELRRRSQNFFAQADIVVAPCHDVVRRIRDNFGFMPDIEVWEKDAVLPLQLRPVISDPRRKRRVCLAGAIGLEKGFEVIYNCALLIEKFDLPLEFSIVGFTCDDTKLLKTGVVHITGRYTEEEAVDLIRRQNADLAFLPALWPETWSFVLSQFWASGLPVVAFDIGAPAERIRANNGGVLIPLGASPEKIVKSLLAVASAH